MKRIGAFALKVLGYALLGAVALALLWAAEIGGFLFLDFAGEVFRHLGSSGDY
jgi:hypothetical protein